MKKKKRWITYGSFALILVAVYFINVEVQTYLGNKALKATGLENIEINAAMDQARDQSKYVLANVSAIWCPSCRTLDREVFSDEAVQREIRERFVFSRIEYESEEGQRFMAQYALTGFPNLLVIDPDGKLIKQLPVTSDPERFRSELPR